METKNDFRMEYMCYWNYQNSMIWVHVAMIMSPNSFVKIRFISIPKCQWNF